MVCAAVLKAACNPSNAGPSVQANRSWFGSRWAAFRFEDGSVRSAIKLAFLRGAIDSPAQFHNGPGIEPGRRIKRCPIHALESGAAPGAGPLRQGARCDRDPPPKFEIFRSHFAPQPGPVKFLRKAKVSRSRRSEFCRIVHYSLLVFPFEGTVDVKQST
jgi:hypothetical protein